MKQLPFLGYRSTKARARYLKVQILVSRFINNKAENKTPAAVLFSPVLLDLIPPWLIHLNFMALSKGARVLSSWLPAGRVRACFHCFTRLNWVTRCMLWVGGREKKKPKKTPDFWKKLITARFNGGGTTTSPLVLQRERPRTAGGTLASPQTLLIINVNLQNRKVRERFRLLVLLL